MNVKRKVKRKAIRFYNFVDHLADFLKIIDNKRESMFIDT